MSTFTSYRDYINERKELLNLSAICRESDVQKQALHTFLKGYDNAVSLDKLNKVIDVIKSIS